MHLKPDTIVVNVGDLMERWSNDIFKRYALPDLFHVSIPDRNCTCPAPDIASSPQRFVSRTILLFLAANPLHTFAIRTQKRLSSAFQRVWIRRRVRSIRP